MGKGAIKVHVLYECGLCDNAEDAWIPFHERQATTSQDRPDGWVATHEKGMVCPKCWESWLGPGLTRVMRGL